MAEEAESVKKIVYKGYDVVYKIRKSEYVKDHYYITVAGGPHRVRAFTSCGQKDIKGELMKLIKSIGPKRLGRRTPEQERKLRRIRK